MALNILGFENVQNILFLLALPTSKEFNIELEIEAFLFQPFLFLQHELLVFLVFLHGGEERGPVPCEEVGVAS